MRKALLIIIAFVATCSWICRADDEALTYEDIAMRLYDFERLVTPPVEGERGAAWISADRRGRYDAATGQYGIFFDHGKGQCLLLARDVVQFGEIKADGSNLKIKQTSSRDMEFGPTVTFRLVIKLDMMELYIDDYLMNLKRVECNGQVGFMGADHEGAFKNIKVWQSN